MAKNFWSNPIDYNNELLHINKSPFVLQEEAPFSKIHFLFTMLNINMLFIVKHGIMTGLITKLEFIKKRKDTVTAKQSIYSRQRDILKSENLKAPDAADYERFFLKL